MATVWRDLALDSTGDLDFDGKDFALVKDADAIGQQLGIALRLWAGEYPFDTTLGVDWATLLNEKGVTDEQIAAEVRRVALSVDGVTAVDTVEIVRDTATRAATITVAGRADTAALLVSVTPAQEV